MSFNPDTTMLRQLIRQVEQTSPVPSNYTVSADDLVLQAEEHFNVSGSSVLAAWLLATSIGIATMAVFSTVRSKDKELIKLFYFPRLRHRIEMRNKWLASECKAGIAEPIVPKVEVNFLGWLTPQIKMWWHESWQPLRPSGIRERDYDLLELLGLDAVTYLLFMRMLRWLFLSITLLAALPLTLANYYINTRTEYGSIVASGKTSNPTHGTRSGLGREDASAMAESLLDNMLIFTAANIKGNGLWVHIGIEWAVTGLVILFVMTYSLHYDTLVQKWIEMNYNQVSFKSILVTNIHIGQEREDRNEKGKKVKRTNYVSDAKNEVCRVLGLIERPYTTYVTDPKTEKRIRVPAGCKVTLTYRNMSYLAKRIEDYKKGYFPEFEKALTAVLRRGKAQFGRTQVYGSLWARLLGAAPEARTIAWVSLITQGVSERMAVQGAKVEALKQEIEKEQAMAKCDADMERSTPVTGNIRSAFVTFRSAKRAYQVIKAFKKSQKIHKRLTGPDVQRAPRAKNIIWKNLDKTSGKSKHGYSGGGLIVLIIVFTFNTVPLAAITILANFDALLAWFPTLKNAQETSTFWTAIFAIIGGVLPPAIAALFSYILPYVVRRLNKWSGALTRGQLDKMVVRQLFIWLLVFNFIFFSLLGVIWDSFLILKQDIGRKSFLDMMASLGDIPAKVTRAYISQSSYWLSWYPIRSLAVCVQLLQLPRIAFKVFQSFTATTGSDIHELSKPPNFEFAIEYIHALFAMVVALVYTPLAPIVSACSTVYFWAMSVVHYNQLMYVENTKETDGKCWRIARNRVLVATVLMQLLMTLTIWLKTRTPGMILPAAGPILLVIGVKYFEGEDDLFIKNSELIALAPDVPLHDYSGESIPEYEHELLRKDWRPAFICDENDRKELQEAKLSYKWLDGLLTKASVDTSGIRRATRRRK